MKFSLTRFLTKTLELKEKEARVFILLFFHSFFLGWFIAFYFAAVNSEFVVQFGIEYLPYAYIIAGIAGYLVTSFYTYIQNKISTKALFTGALAFMFLIAIIGRFGLGIVDNKLLTGFVFIWAWPFISLSGTESGGLALRFLNLVQVKRLFGLFNMGGVLSAIIGYFAIIILKPIVSHLFDLLIIGAVGLIASIFILFRLYKHDPSNEEQFRKESTKEKNNLKNIFKEKYFLWIFLSTTLSMIIIYFTDFAFLSSVKVQIKPENIAQYLAIVYGGLKIGELIISYFSRRLLTDYGVKLGLTILPITVAVLVIASAIWGIMFGIGLFFLITMTALKSLERILRRGLDDPAFNILYQPIADDQKMAIQSRVGVVMQFSIAIAGAILVLANLLLKKDGVFQQEYFPLFFLPIAGLWVFVAIKLYYSYKDKIKEILSEISKDKRRGTDQYQYASEILRKHLKDDSYFAISFSATVLSETNPKTMEAYASNLIKDVKNPFLLKVVLQNIDPTWRRRLAKNIEEVIDNSLPDDVLRIAQYSINNLEYANLKETLSEQEANALWETGKTGKRIELIKYIHKHAFKPSEDFLLKMFDDDEKIIRISVINLSTNFKYEKVIQKIVSLLEVEEYRHIASNALLDLGSRVLIYLEHFFKENAKIEVLLLVIEIYAKIGSDEAKKLLIKHLNYPNKEIQISVIFALFYCKYEASEDHKAFIIQKIEEIIDNILWILAAMQDIEGQHNTLKLFLALDLEKEFYYELLFLLLSFLYEPRIITLVQKNIIGKDTIFALEIMDNFFDTDIKKLITPIFDDITPSQKLKRLHGMFPQQHLELSERLKEIILQDYSRLDPWTQAKAIELLGKLHKKNADQKNKNSEFLDFSDISLWKKERILLTLDKIRRSEIPDEVFVAMYHTNEVIFSMAAKIIFEENPIKCFDYLANMSLEKQNLMHKLSNNELLIDDKVKYLKRFSIFFNIPENILPNLAKIALIKKVAKGKFIEIFNNKKDIIIMIIRGVLEFSDSENSKKIFAKNDIIIRGINIDNFALKLEATTDSLLIVFDRLQFFNSIISNKEIVRHILSDTDQLTWVLD